MLASEFANACKRERDSMWASYVDPAGTSVVSELIRNARLTDVQLERVKQALDCALTDAFYAMLLGLDGGGSLGGDQQPYKLVDASGRVVSNGGDLEAAAYKAFYPD